MRIELIIEVGNLEALEKFEKPKSGPLIRDLPTLGRRRTRAIPAEMGATAPPHFNEGVPACQNLDKSSSRFKLDKLLLLVLRNDL